MKNTIPSLKNGVGGVNGQQGINGKAPLCRTQIVLNLKLFVSYYCADKMSYTIIKYQK